MAQSTVHITISSAAHLKRSMTRFYPRLKPLIALAEGDDTLPQVRRDRILETFLHAFDGLPEGAANDCDDIQAAWNTSKPSRSNLRAEKRGQWSRDVAEQYEGADRLFADRCAAAFIELYGNS